MRSALRLITLLLVVTGLLTACTTRRYDNVVAKYAGIPPNSGRIFFYQLDLPDDAVSSRPYLWLDKAQAGRTRPGGFFFVNRPAGTYKVWTPSDRKNGIKVTLEAGETRYVKVTTGDPGGKSSGFGRMLIREEVSEEKALQELSTLTYWGGASRERKILKRDSRHY
jgi:hypothetical protein